MTMTPDDLIPSPTELQIGEHKCLVQLAKVTEIEFDFNVDDEEDELSQEEMDDITESALNEWGIAVEGNETETEFSVLLTDRITDQIGYCIESIEWEFTDHDYN